MVTTMEMSSAPRRNDDFVSDVGCIRESTGKVAYFAPDAADPAVVRRIEQWRRAGHSIYAFVFVRSRSDVSQTSSLIVLGHLAHQSRMTRPLALLRALAHLWRWRSDLSGVQLFVARNLDNAVLAILARRMAGSTAPLVYEVLDINRSCTEGYVLAFLLRRIESWLLKRVGLLVVSSPRYISSYFSPIHGFNGRWLLFENKIPRHAGLPARAVSNDAKQRPWRIGWFGFLDDMKSWAILRNAAEHFPDEIEICVRGKPYNNFDMDTFLADVARLRNVSYGGPYVSPADLPRIYKSIDMIWSMDLNDLSANSQWLLTNSIYEALYFGKPLIGLANTAVGDFIRECGAGWSLEYPLEEHLKHLIADLSEAAYRSICRSIDCIPLEKLVESDEIDRIFDARNMELPPPPVGASSVRAR